MPDDLTREEILAAEIERLLGEYHKIYDWGEALDRDRNTLTADLAAARATIKRVEALAKEWEGTADMFDARTIGGSAAGNTIRRMVGELRAALRGDQEGVKDADAY